jgi:peptide/nickel transport system permease protein
MLPKDPAFLWSGSTQIVNEEQLEAIRQQYHLHDPWYLQYMWYLTRILQGDLGTSPNRKVPIANELATVLPPTIELGFFSLSLSIVVGITIGILSATRERTWVDHGSRVWALANVSFPSFWIALIFQLVFYYYLRWFSDPGGIVNQETIFRYPLQRVTGFYTLDSLVTGNWPVLLSVLEHLLMPGLIMSFFTTAMIARITRASMLEVMSQDYVRTAKAYGLPERVVIYKMALKNAMIPTTTTIGLAVGWLLTGSVVVETVFYWPGIGRYVVQQIQTFDFPGLIGYVIVAATFYSVANLIVDLLYAFLDPRIRQG